MEQLRRHCHSLTILNAVLLLVLIAVCAGGCCAFRNARRAEYAYGGGRMSKIHLRWDYFWKVKYSGDKGIGIPQILRAFVRVFYATSTEELEEMAMEAVENDGRLARRPLKHAEREVHAHRKLLSHLDNMIRDHSTAIEQIEIVDDTASRSMHPFRKEMAKDILAGELQVFGSARAWVAKYCETVKIS